MDRFTFCAEIVKATAWPATAIVLALLLRHPIRGLLDGIKLRKLKRGDWEAEFSEARQELLLELPAAAKTLPKDSDDLATELETVLERSPTEAILSGWNRIEKTVHGIGERHGVAATAFMTTLDELVRKRVLKTATMNSLLGLRQLRNLAVHGPTGEISQKRAREFLAMADATLWTLRSENKGAAEETGVTTSS